MSEKALKRYLKHRDKKERGQLTSRRHLGILEKKKDYRVRVQNFNKKRDHLRKLQTKAELRNPDEYYKEMNDTKVDENGNIVTTQQKRRDQAHIFSAKTLDKHFIEQKIQGLRKEIIRDRDNLAALGSFDKVKGRTHGIFVETQDEADEWDAAEHFKTLPQLVGRSHNRLTVDQLNDDIILNKKAPGMLHKAETAKDQAYSSVRQKEKTLKEMERHQQTLAQQRNLMKGGRVTKIVKKDKFGDEIKSKTRYKWKTERKK